MNDIVVGTPPGNLLHVDHPVRSRAQTARELRRVEDSHLRTLTRIGLLPASAIRETLSAASLQYFRFTVETGGVRAIPLSVDEPPPAGHQLEMHELRYQDCRLLFYGRLSKRQRDRIMPVLRHCQFVTLNTLVWKNFQKARYREIYAKLREEIEATDDNITIETLPRLIKRHLGISVEIVERVAEENAAFFVRRNKLGQSRADGKRIDDPRLVKLIITEALGKAATLDVTTQIGGQRRGREDPIVIVPLCRSSADKSSRSQLFLLSGTRRRPLTQQDIATVEAVVTFFLDEVLYGRQRDYILAMLSEIVAATSENAESQHEDIYARVLQRTLNRIVTDTTAYRCSMWHLDLRTNHISPDKMASYERGKLQDSYVVAQPHIRPSYHRQSSIAYVMRGAEGHGFVIVHDCANATLDLVGSQLAGIIKPSGETQSELAVQVRSGAVPHSVLLVESRLVRGLESDAWYIRTLCFLLSELRRVLEAKLDSTFIAERLSLFDNSHDLDVFIDLNLQSEPEIANNLRAFLKLGVHDHDAPDKEIVFEIQDLLDEIEEKYAFRTPEAVTQIFNKIHVDDVPPLVMTSSVRKGILYILKNLISNAFRYEAGSSSTIGIRIEADSTSWADATRPPLGRELPRGTGKILHIDCVITPALDAMIEGKIGRRRIAQGDRGGRRGLYLIGLISRQLGGVFEVDRSQSGLKSKLVIRLPVKVSQS